MAHVAAHLKEVGPGKIIVDGTDLTDDVQAVLIRCERGGATKVILEMPSDVRLNVEGVVERTSKASPDAVLRWLEGVNPDSLESEVAKIADFGSRPGPDYLTVLKKMAANGASANAG